MPAARMSRRTLLFGSAPAGLRPPWALEEQQFIEACTGCRACVEHCPENVLRIGSGGFPVFDPQLGECTFCGDCVDACAPQALARGNAARPWNQLAVVDDACLAAHGVVCGSCREICPESAIRFAPALLSKPSVDSDCCSGCGACVGVCPAGAIGLNAAQVETI